MTNQVNRRQILRGGAMAAAAGAVATLAAVPALAAAADRLIPVLHRYNQAVEAFNAADHPTDAAFDAHYDAMVGTAELAIVGVPAATRADALAAFDMISDEWTDAAGDFGAMMNSLRDAVRGYIERGQP